MFLHSKIVKLIYYNAKIKLDECLYYISCININIINTSNLKKSSVKQFTLISIFKGSHYCKYLDEDYSCNENIYVVDINSKLFSEEQKLINPAETGTNLITW